MTGPEPVPAEAEHLEILAATACLAGQELLLQALAARPELSQAELAQHVGVTQGRISQVMHADSVTNIALLARYLGALGYRLEMRAQPIAGNVPELAVAQSRG
jgi:transcriptional regulator with XRE-family HTH domain